MLKSMWDRKDFQEDIEKPSSHPHRRLFKFSGFCSFYWKLCVCVCVCAQLCLTLCNPMDCSPPGSSVHGISQARILKWVAIPYSKGSSQLRDGTQVSCNGRQIFFFFTTEIHLLFRNIHIHLVDYNLSKAKPGYHSFINFPTSYDHQHFLLIPQHKLESDNCQDRYRELLSSPYILDYESFEDRLLCVLHRRDGQIIVGAVRKQLLLLLSRSSRVRLCATPETAAHQDPPSLGFSRQEHWSGLPF